MRSRTLVIDLAWGLGVALLWNLGFELGISRGWQPQDPDAWLVAAASVGVAVAVRRGAPPWLLALLALAYPLLYFRPLVSYFHLMPLLVLGFAGAQRSPRRPWLALASVSAGVAILFSPLVDATSRAPLDLLDSLQGDHPGELYVDQGEPVWVPGRPAYQTNWSGLALAEFAAVSVVLLGAAIASQRRVAEDLAARNEELERLRRVEADRAVADERLRISRDLHDVVAHHLTAILMRAQAADRVRASRPDEAADAVAWIAEESRDALRATRATISSLRDHRATGGPLDRDLVTDLEEIMDRLGQVGLDARLDVRWQTEPPLAPTVGVAVRRVVQEALTNVLKHARASQAQVVLREVRGGLGIDIVDDGVTATTLADRDRGAPSGGGAGLVGMQERLSACGGQLRYGPVEPTGWRVRLWVPTATGGPP